MPLPYRVAVLCYLHDPDGRVLLLHRAKNPNAGMYSPIGGKLETECGESPHACAVREIEEEAGLSLADDEVRLLGIISEAGYEGDAHWLLFLFEVTRPVHPDEVATMEISEGRLEWIDADRVADLEIPETDRAVMWPLVQRHRGGFFMAHIECCDGGFQWRLQESVGG